MRTRVCPAEMRRCIKTRYTILIDADLVRRKRVLRPLAQIDLSEAVDAVKSGGVIAFPTDTFYALGVDAMNELAIRKAFEIKRRPANTPMPVLISEISQAEVFTSGFNAASHALAERFWPGALTIVVEANDDLPDVLTGGLDTVGLRMPDHDLACRLMTEAGCGITGTSANVSGEPPAKDWRVVDEAIGIELDAIVIGECGNESAASTVVQVVDSSVRILRQGPISADEIQATLAEISYEFGP